MKIIGILVMGALLTVWIPIVMAPWIIAGPGRMVKKLRSRFWLTN